MSKLKNLKEVLIDELRDIYNAELQILKAMPFLEEASSNSSLKEAVAAHLVETKQQVKRLEEISGLLSAKLAGKVCKSMRGLIEEASDMIQEECSSDYLKDILLIGAMQRIEHYEIAAYSNARSLAEELEEHEVASLLQDTLEEESATDDQLTLISQSEILPETVYHREDYVRL